VSRLPLALAVAVACLACNPTKLKQGYCHTNADCGDGGVTCNKITRKCEAMDASMDRSEVGDAGGGRDGSDAQDAFTCNRCGDAGADGGPSVCDMDARMCVECLADGHCNADGSVSKVCDTSTRTCVGCLADGHCNADGSVSKVCDTSTRTCVGCLPSNDICTGTTPICTNKTCRPCTADTQCATGICMEDGHCAGTGEILFVEFNSNGCPGADGTSAKPYCAPNEAVAQLLSNRNVIVIRGPTADRMVLNTTGVAPVVVGKPATGNVPASIPATAATAVQVLSDTVLIRDLTINGGTAATSKGIVVAGSSTVLSLLNVRVNVVTGLGLQADTGTQLKMNRCTIDNNSRGGVQLGTLSFDITNTVIAKNGPGMDTGGVTWGGLRINATGTTVPSSTRFVNNTIVENNPVAFSCATDISINQSIVFGNTSGDGAGCTIATCCSTGNPLLTTTYRLMSGSPCADKIDTTMSLPDDIDGQARPNGVKSDCGADEL
jgi:hypothetical protein